MKQIVISLTDDEWKEISDTIQHEFGEPLNDEKVENIMRKHVAKFIRDTYIRGLGA